MAYPQRPMQQPPQRQYDNRRPPQAAGWQGQAQAQAQDGYYDQGYGYDNYNGYYDDRGAYDDAGYGQYNDYTSPRTHGPPRPQPRPERGGYGPPQEYQRYNQGYPYDDQQSQHGYSDRGYSDAGGYPPRSRGNGQMRRPPPPQQRPRPSQEQPMSPVKGAWDGPFPAFPLKERRRGPPETGIEKRMAGLDINERSSPVRGPESRPSTSHSSGSERSRRRGDPSYPNDYPGRSAGDGYDTRVKRSMSGGQRGGPPAAYGAPYGGQAGRPYIDSNIPPEMPQQKRSATMPVPPTNMPPPRKPQYPGQTTYQEPPLSPTSGYAPGPPRPSTTSGSRPNQMPGNAQPDSQGYPYQPSSQNTSTAQEKDASDDFLDHYLDSHQNNEPDMPNFDAMPNNDSNQRSDHLIPGVEEPKAPGPPDPPASGSRGQYAAYKPEFSAQAHRARSQPNLRTGDSPSDLANAGFQFDLPNETPPVPPMSRQNSTGGGPGRQSNEYGDPMNRPYPPRQASRGAPVQGYPDPHGGYGPKPPPQRYGTPMQDNGPPRPYRSNQPGPPPNDPRTMGGMEPQDPQNFDSLPSHPAPFRPGLDQAKPAPVRQYDNAQLQGAQQGGPMDRPPSGLVTHEELQRLQKMVRDKPTDHATHLILAKKMVEAATVLVDQDGRADAKTRNKNREKYIMDAYKIVKKLVHAGYPDAMFYLADCYGQGLLGLEVDTKEAFQLYQSAGKQGHAESAYRVAVCCELGHEEGGGTKRDPFKAVQWYKRAAALGDTPAMYKMGMILLKGLLGQQKNPREGISWLKRAAERADEENPHALHELGLLYESANNNDIIIRDEEYAKQLFHQAAELGYKFSQFRLGAAYEYGLMNCPVDARQSIIWYTRAAAQGEHQSELALSGWYLTGAEGILQQSDTEAYLWARKAASAGLAKAEYAMGYFTEVGIGVPSNLDDAKRWYWRAASQNFAKARERLEELKKGGGKMQKTRVSRSAVSKQNEGDCIVM
ncbi:hypothetical protein VTN00DRAFT_8865 [Thermoascus crustaceus]|uniref:uncharacterized protein n=1 Tax=Thermoascus crustaceus TaxID=5088 RepID=UPI0037438BF3